MRKDLPVMVKYTPCHYLDYPGYRKIEEGVEMSKLLNKRGSICCMSTQGRSKTIIWPAAHVSAGAGIPCSGRRKSSNQCFDSRSDRCKTWRLGQRRTCVAVWQDRLSGHRTRDARRSEPAEEAGRESSRRYHAVHRMQQCSEASRSARIRVYRESEDGCETTMKLKKATTAKRCWS